MGYGIEVRKAIGRRLARLRVEKGWTQKQLAEALGVSQAFVTRIETGDKAVPDGQVNVLFDTLGASADDLFLDTREEGPQAAVLKDLASGFYCAGEKETDLAVGLLHTFMKCTPQQKIQFMLLVKEIIKEKSITPVAEGKLLKQIKQFVRENSADESEEYVEELLS
ncbi:helix-turn-helix domain-containing protein [Geomesophilobacter sediminis]|uniref:Helix-turn-helix domain-containing protein n=1 Tax=Geomesophilobacter sediminis TaxID=2798584 RepID=A0A8J7IPN6_9BACT|nr:helix-turn-helix transcriptional regulator [Geomesophilobacter sediminis]MBJ6724399.1 helix-turn-helix domain-containing protein [Geomesophilobacter sediminis]